MEPTVRENFEAVRDQIKGQVAKAYGLQNQTVDAPANIAPSEEAIRERQQGPSPMEAAEEASQEPSVEPRQDQGESGDRSEQEVKPKTAKRIEQLLEERKSSDKRAKALESELERMRAKLSEAEAEQKRAQFSDPDSILPEGEYPKGFDEWDSRRQTKWIAQQIALKMSESQLKTDDPELLAIKEERRLRRELSDEDLTSAQLQEVISTKERFPTLPTEECLVLARHSNPELFAGPGGALPDVPAAHRVQTPSGERRANVSKTEDEKAAEDFQAARSKGDRYGMQQALVRRIKQQVQANYPNL